MVSIVYISQGGSTKRYAQTLASKIGCDCYSLEEAESSIKKGSDIIFMGWRSGPMIVGIQPAKERYNIIATVCVGLERGQAKHMQQMMNKNDLDGMLFYIRGGMDRSVLDKKQKRILSAVNIIYILFRHSADDKKTREVMMHGGDFSSDDQLDQIIDWYNAVKH